LAKTLLTLDLTEEQKEKYLNIIEPRENAWRI